MATYTPNLNLKKPDATDTTVIRTDYNANLDIIDSLAKNYPVKWSGLGMGMFTPATSYFDTLISNGFTEVRIDIPTYTDTAWLADSKVTVLSAVAKGLNVIWGISSGSTTITAANWETFETAIESAAAWAQANGVYEFQLGNEEESHNDNTTLTDAQLIIELKSVATDVQAIFTNGNVSYTCSADFIDDWATAGKGNIDIIASNVYMEYEDHHPRPWQDEIDALVAAFGVGGTYLTEFNLNWTSLDSYSTDESVQAAGVTIMLNYIKASGMTRAFWFCWKEAGDDFGVIKADGTYRQLWNSLVGSEVSSGFATDKTQWVYPQDYASGTGTVGDPWAGDCLNDALAACPNGGTIYMRAGYYTLASTLYSATKSYNLIGEGINKTFIVLDIANAYGIYIATDYCTLKGFTIDGTSQGDDTFSDIGFDTGTDYVILEDIEAKNSGSCGINILEANHLLLHNIYAHDNHIYGIHPGSDVNTRNMYNTYRDIYCWNNGSDGFDDDGQAPATPAATFNVYDNIHAWDNGRYGIAIVETKSITISNCSASGNTTKGYYFNALTDANINNCISSGNTTSGIIIYASNNVNFTNCISKNNIASGMVLSGTTATFTSCQFYDDQGTPTQDYGIELYSSSTIIISNCKLTPNVSGTIYNDGGTSTYTAITGVASGYTPVAGDILYHNGTNWVRLAKGTANQYLKMNGTATAPIWVT